MPDEEPMIVAGADAPVVETRLHIALAFTWTVE